MDDNMVNWECGTNGKAPLSNFKADSYKEAMRRARKKGIYNPKCHKSLGSSIHSSFIKFIKFHIVIFSFTAVLLYFLYLLYLMFK